MLVHTFRGTLKQLAIAQCDSSVRELLTACFPNFTAETQSDVLKKHFPSIEFRGNHHTSVPVAHGRLRRFGGGPDLGGGRYFTVCNDDKGNDNGTLVNELMSYWDERNFTLLNPLDSSLQYDREVECANEPGGPFLVLRGRAYKPRRFTNKLKPGGVFSVALPLSVQQVEIHDVVDLRSRDTQEWFVRHFVGLEEECGRRGHQTDSTVVVAVKVRQPHDFAAMLPTLVHPMRGGMVIHEAIGAWLRSHGAAGLIFPSARRDVSVRTDGRLTIFDGWNFVDYRGAAPITWEHLFGRQPAWLREPDARIKVDRFTGSWHGWAIRGAQTREYSNVMRAQQRLITMSHGPFRRYIERIRRACNFALYSVIEEQKKRARQNPDKT